MTTGNDVMPPIRKRSLTGRLTIGVGFFLALFMLLYVGAYFGLVGKAYRSMGVNPANGLIWFKIEAEYSMGGDWVQHFFTPAHALDRLIRSGRWEIIEDPDTGPYRNPRPSGPSKRDP